MLAALGRTWWEFRAASSFCRPIWGCRHVEGVEVDTPALEFVNCLCFLLWCVPNFSVYTGGFLTIIFRHSSNGENLAAVRVGQQALQGSHLAPSAFLCCLRDTHLESANVAVNGLPVDGVPLRRFA